MYHELPVGAVVRLRNNKTATIVETPKQWLGNDLYPVVGVIDGNTPNDIDSWTSAGQFVDTFSDDLDIVAVVHYGTPPVPDPDIAEIDRYIDLLRDLGVGTPKTCGSLVPPEQRQEMIQKLRAMIPPERVKAPVAEALKEDETERRIRSLLHIYRRTAIDPPPPIRLSSSLGNMATHVDFIPNVAKAIEEAFEIKITERMRDEWKTVQDVVLTVKHLQDPTCAASGAGCDFIYTPRFDLYGCRYCGRDAAPEEDKELRELDAPKSINRIERSDVENFRTGNYTTRNALDQYQEIATRSAIYPGQGTPFGIMYTALGLAEAGEIQNKVKKMFRDDGVIEFVDTPFREGDTLVRFKTLTPERRAAIIKEMGGNLWYLAALAKEIGTTLSEVAGNNLDELCGRTERDTLNGDGDDR